MSRRCWQQAARRHFRDAEYLLTDTPPRVDNADHLFGVCADSVANVLFDLAREKQGARFAESDKIHINRCWQELLDLRSSRSVLSQHLQNLPLSNPFADWNVNQRYRCDGQVTAAVMAKHHAAAQKMLGVLDALHVAGVLS